MGQGIEMARAEAPEHAQALENFRDQLLIALLLRLGPNVTVPIAEVDATGDYIVAMSITGGNFNFVVEKKS